MKIDFALFSAVAASHFRAVSLQYQKLNQTHVKVERSIGWRRAYGYDDFNGCTQSQLGLRSYYGQVHEAITGIPGTFPSYYSLTNLEDHPSVDPNSQWCFGRETFAVDLHGITSFTHTGDSCCTIPFLDDNWNIGAGSTRYLGQNNNVLNNGPIFPTRPIWVIMEGCTDQVYSVDALEDAEGNTIRCRWATEDESAHFYHRTESMRSFYLDAEACTVTYRPEFDNSGPGNKPIALMVEDFDGEPLPENLLHSSPSFFIAITFQPDLESSRSSDKLLYSESYPEHDENDHDDHGRRRRQAAHIEPDYCHGSPTIITEGLTDEQLKFFDYPGTVETEWCATYNINGVVFTDFPRFQFDKPDGMICSSFGDDGCATCTWDPTPVQAIEGEHSNCLQIYDPYGRGSDRQCLTLVLNIELECEEGYGHAVSDDGVSLVCVDIDECYFENPCGDNATCENNDGGYSCICDDGFVKNDAGECVWPAASATDAAIALKNCIEETTDVLQDNGRFGKFETRVAKLTRNALNSISDECETPFNAEKYGGNNFSILKRDHVRSDDHCTQVTAMQEAFQAFVDNYSCMDGKKAKEVKRTQQFITKMTNPYC